VTKLSTTFCAKCGHKLEAGNEFCPKCGTPVEGAAAVAQAPAQPAARKGFSAPGVGKWVIVAIIVFLILVVPVFPRDRILYVDGTTQTVTNQIQYSTSFQVYTTTTSSQVAVYAGSYQYFSNYYYNYYNSYWGGNYCYWYHHQIVCNYNYWPWYGQSYGTTVTVTPGQQVVSVTRTQQSSGLESLTLTYLNGQSTTVQNVYNDNLTPSGAATVQSTAVVTNTVTNTITTPVTQTVPCHQCIPQHVTDHVSILQLLLGY
jgi:zinc ribbon protein